MTKPQPADPAAVIYRGEQGKAYHDGKRQLRPDALPWVMAMRAEKFQRHVSRTDIVFEYGVGSGWNLGKLECARKIGCDAATFLRERVQALGVEFVENTAKVASECVDVAICHQTLEHVLEPASCLAELARILKPGGMLIIHVPWERERRYFWYDPTEPNHHLYTWNAQTLGNLLEVAGFAVESVTVRRYGWDRFAANAASRLGLGERGFRLLRWLMIALRPLMEVEGVARKSGSSRNRNG